MCSVDELTHEGGGALLEVGHERLGRQLPLQLHNDKTHRATTTMRINQHV